MTGSAASTGSSAGALTGAAIGSVVPGIGTAIGGLAGGLIGGGIGNAVGGSGGGGAAGAGSTNPSATPGTATAYIPQAQQQADYSYQGVVNQLNNMGWAGLNQLGGQTPATQTYPTAQNIVGSITTPGQQGGTYGPYADQAMWGAEGAANTYLGAFNTTGFSPMSSANMMQSALQQYLPQVQAAYQNPQIQAIVNQIAGIPSGQLGQQAMDAAQTGAYIGGYAPGYAPGQVQQLNQLGSTLPGQAQATANLIGQNISPSQQMAQQGAWTAQTPANIPQSQQLAGLSGMYGQLPANIPQQQQLAGMAGGLAPAYAQQLQGAYAPLQAAGNQILQTGFDPQQRLFNQQENLVQQQQNALNAMSGVGTSPYGAGVTGQALQNFDINWQNQQLQRQTQAAQAAQGIAGMLPGFQQQAMANLQNAQGMQAAPTALAGQQLSNLLNAQQAQAAPTALGGQSLANLANAQQMQAAPGQLGLQQLNAILQGGQGAQNLYAGALGLGTGAGQAAAAAGMWPAQAQTQLGQNALQALTGGANLTNQGVSALGGLGGAMGTAGQNQLAAIQALAASQGLPYGTSMTQAQNALNALGSQQQLGQGMIGLPQSVLSEMQSYLGLGQAASGLSGQLGNLGALQLASGLGGIGMGLTGLGGFSGLSNLGSTVGGGISNLYNTGFVNPTAADLNAADFSGGLAGAGAGFTPNFTGTIADATTAFV